MWRGTKMESLEKKIESLGVRQKYAKNAFLFLAQDPARGFYFVLKGEIRVFRMDDKGRELEIVRLRPGEFFGEAIALLSGRFPAFARAVKDSEVFYFEKQTVLREIEKDPSTARFFLILLARKCAVLNERIETLGLRTVRQRLAQYLLNSCGSREAECLVQLEFKKTELARLLGTISETLSRNLRGLQQDGLIEVKGRRIRIKECSRLRKEIPG
jgi:CRP-like cAMP-binding protein